MLNEICIKISEAILGAVRAQIAVKDGMICNPEGYFGSIHRLQSAVLGIVTHHDLNGHATKLDDIFTQLDRKLNAKCLFSKAFENCSELENQALSGFLHWFQVQDLEAISLSDLYELILSLEFPIQNGQIIEDRSNLNFIGSFYTPRNLADKIVALTLDNYIFQNTGLEGFSSSAKTETEIQLVSELLSNSTFADHSCGTGSLLLAILRYCDNHLGSFSEKVKQNIITHLTAIEVDSIALEIARIRMLSSSNCLHAYTEYGGNFIHGNPLILPNNDVGPFHFSFEFYNHNKLAIDPERISKCDVIVGNPPWGTVSFDLQYFMHILCPQLSEIEDGPELDPALEKMEVSHSELYNWLLRHDEANDLAIENLYNDERFEYSNMGGLQTNVLFTQLENDLSTERGVVGLLLKGATLSDPVNKRLVDHLQSGQRIIARYDFLNTDGIFNIGKDEQFSILLLGSNNTDSHVHKKNLTALDRILD